MQTSRWDGVVRMSWLIGRVLFATWPHDHAVGDHPSGTTVTGRLVRSTRTLGRAALERVRGLRSRPASFLILLQVGFTEPHRSPGALVVSYTTVSPLPIRRSAVCFLWHCPAGCPGWVLPTTLPCGARTFLGSPKVAAVARPAHPHQKRSAAPARRCPGRRCRRSHGLVRTSAPSAVTRSVCSNWALRRRSLVTTVQSSSHMVHSWVPRLSIGSIVKVMPTSIGSS